MTNCSPASSRSRWCARIMRRPAGRGTRRRRPAARRRSSRPCPIRSRSRSSRRSPTSSPISPSPQRMLRLLQGDVGSGKTVVALLAAAAVIEAGRQAALMAPTEILARQHLQDDRAARRGRRHSTSRSSPAASAARERSDDPRAARARRHRSPGRHARAVPGRRRVPRSRARRRRRAAPLRRAPAPGAGAEGRGRRRAGADRDADPAHAGADLFRRHGRLRTAREAGRPPADRHPHHSARRGSTKSIDAVGRALDEGQRAYWVCPLVEESEKIDLAAAEERFAELQQQVRRRRRSRARPHEGRREGRRHGALRRRRDAAPRRHHGDRGRRRRAGGDHHGDRARRALRARAAPSVARPRRARRGPLDLPAALQGAARRDRQGAPRDHARDRGRLPHRRGGFAAARRRRRARHAAERHAGLPHRAPGGARQVSRRRARRCAARPVARSRR